MDVKQRKVNDRRQNGARHILPTSIQSVASSTSSSSIQRGQNNRCTHTNDLQSINKLEALDLTLMNLIFTRATQCVSAVFAVEKCLSVTRRYYCA